MVVFRCHLLGLASLCWRQRSAGAITAQSTRAPAERHRQGPDIRYIAPPNGCLRRMATIHFHLPSLILHLFSSGVFIFLTLCFSFASSVSGETDQQRRKKKIVFQMEVIASVCLRQEVLPCGYNSSAGPARRGF